MSDLTLIRALISDTPVYVKEPVDLVGASGQVVYSPLVARGANGVIITLASGAALNPATNPLTVDYEAGLITFTGTVPAPQQLTVEYSHVSLTDVTLEAIIDFNATGADPIRLAAADALDAIASSQAMIEKKIKLLDMETDGPAVAKALREHAMVLRKLVFDSAFEESTFDLVEQVNPPDAPAWWEKVRKDWVASS